MSKSEVVRRDEYGNRIAVIHAYAPGDGDLSFVARDPETNCAVGPSPTEQECLLALPEGWILYTDGYNWRARKTN